MDYVNQRLIVKVISMTRLLRETFLKLEYKLSDHFHRKNGRVKSGMNCKRVTTESNLLPHELRTSL